MRNSSVRCVVYAIANNSSVEGLLRYCRTITTAARIMTAASTSAQRGLVTTCCNQRAGTLLLIGGSLATREVPATLSAKARSPEGCELGSWEMISSSMLKSLLKCINACFNKGPQWSHRAACETDRK